MIEIHARNIVYQYAIIAMLVNGGMLGFNNPGDRERFFGMKWDSFSLLILGDAATVQDMVENGMSKYREPVQELAIAA